MATQRQTGKAGTARQSQQRTGKPARADGSGKTAGSGRAGGSGRTSGSTKPNGAARASDGQRTVSAAQSAATRSAAGRTGGRAETSARPARDELDASLAPAAPRWRRVAAYPGRHKLEFSMFVLSLVGLGVSIYLTIEHFTQATSLAGCPENSTFNCIKVTTSPQSHVFGIPVAVLGLAFFVFMVAITSPPAWRVRWPAVHWARLGSLIVGMVFVLYLIYAELFLVKAICLYCTAVHVITFILFSLMVIKAAFSGVQPAQAGS